MNTSIPQTVITHVDAMRATFPTPPPVQSRTNQSVASLSRRGGSAHRLGLGLILVGVAAVLLASGAIARHNGIIGTGIAFLAAAGLVLMMTQPAQFETLVARQERELDEQGRTYAGLCASARDTFVANQNARFHSGISAAISENVSLGGIRGDLLQLAAALRRSAEASKASLDAATAEQARQAALFRGARDRLTALARRPFAAFMGSSLRRTTREALQALGRAAEAGQEAAALAAVITGRLAVADSAALFAEGGAPANLAPEPVEHIDSWRGEAVPPAEDIRSAAAARTLEMLPDLRRQVLDEVSRKVPSETAVRSAAASLMQIERPWPATIGSYVAGLNGALTEFTDRLIKDSREWVSTSGTPGQLKHRKVFLFMEGGASSPIHTLLRDRFHDSAGVVTLKHGPDEILLVTEQRNLRLCEIPEAAACIEAFRSAPQSRKEAIITAVRDVRDIIDYSPDAGHGEDRAMQILAVALALRLVVRTGAQTYAFEDKPIAKGYLGTVEALRLDQRLSEHVAAAIASQVKGLGTDQTVDALVAAAADAQNHVPRDAAKAFRTGLADAVDELRRRDVAVA